MAIVITFSISGCRCDDHPSACGPTVCLRLRRSTGTRKTSSRNAAAMRPPITANMTDCSVMVLAFCGRHQRVRSNRAKGSS
jgi:hypothetical protein